MKKVPLLAVVALSSILYFSCKQEIIDSLNPAAATEQTTTGATDRDAGPCDRKVVTENLLAPECYFAELCLPGAYPGFDFNAGELNKHVNGCPVNCNEFIPSGGWHEVPTDYRLCLGDISGSPQISIAKQDEIMAKAHAQAQLYMSQQPALNCNAQGGPFPTVTQSTYKIHFDVLLLPSICTPEQPYNARLRAWVQLGCCPYNSAPTKTPRVG
jgi:hypothetical protein